jgi:type IV secretion system protein TrbI
MANAGVPAPGMPAGTDPEQQRIAQEQEAARVSHLFATTNISQTTTTTVPKPAAGQAPGAPNGASTDLTSRITSSPFSMAP